MLDEPRAAGTPSLEKEPVPARTELPVVERKPAIRIRDLRVAVAGRLLLEKASLDVYPGERVLLVGPSGSGKSVLLKILSGLLEPDDEDHEVSGTVQIGGASVVERDGPRPRARTALVFQDHALFDELTAGENVLFARDHSDSPGAAAAAGRALDFLRAHAIDAGARVRALSGGQKQRVAIARAVARDPEVLLYDEPTSALDPRSARAVAEVVREAGETFGKTSVIVPHDYAPFEGKTTRVVFLDPKAKTLREVPAAEIARVMADAQVDALAPPEIVPPGGPLADLGRATGDGGRAVLSWVRSFFEETPGVIVRLWAKLPFAFWPQGARARWFLRQLVHYARICFLGTAIPYMAIAGIIAGFVATYFTYKFLPKKPWSEPLVLDDVLPGLGFALYRVIVPVLGTVLIAGRTGAALASDVGNRAYLHQVAALKTLGARPEPYLATASLWANVVGTLFLSYIAFWAASWTSLCVFAWTQPALTPYYWSTHFFTKLAPFHLGIVAKGALWVLAKLVICGSGTALIAYEIGTREKKSAAEVSHGITATVYWATLFVLFVHLGFAFWEFDALDDVIGR